MLRDKMVDIMTAFLRGKEQTSLISSVPHILMSTVSTAQFLSHANFHWMFKV